MRRDAVELCGVLAGSKGQVQVSDVARRKMKYICKICTDEPIQALIDASLLPMLLTLLQVDEAVRLNVAKIIKYTSRGTPRQVCLCECLAFNSTAHQVAYLVDHDAVKVACAALQHFKLCKCFAV